MNVCFHFFYKELFLVIANVFNQWWANLLTGGATMGSKYTEQEQMSGVFW